MWFCSDDIDKQVLLAVQYVCNLEGLRINWGKVAQVLGPDFTEGAIVQHLAKLRSKMIDVGLPVPPPMRRGTLQTPSKVYAGGGSILYSSAGSAARKRAQENVTPTKKVTAKGTLKRMDDETDDELNDDIIDYSPLSTKLKAKTKKPPSKKRNVSAELNSGSSFDDVEVKQEADATQRKATLRQTSRNKVDYAKLAGDDEAEEGDAKDYADSDDGDDEEYGESKFHDEDVDSIFDQDETPQTKKAKIVADPQTNQITAEAEEASGQWDASPPAEADLGMPLPSSSKVVRLPIGIPPQTTSDHSKLDDSEAGAGVISGLMPPGMPYTISPATYHDVGPAATPFMVGNPYGSYDHTQNAPFGPHYHSLPDFQSSIDLATTDVRNASFNSMDLSADSSIGTPAGHPDGLSIFGTEAQNQTYSSQYIDDSSYTFLDNMDVNDNVGNGELSHRNYRCADFLICSLSRRSGHDVVR